MTATYMVVPNGLRPWTVDVVVDHPTGKRTRADQVTVDDLAMLEVQLAAHGYRPVAP